MIPQMRQENGRNSNIGLDDLSLREAGLRIEYFIQVRNRDGRALNDQLGFAGIGPFELQSKIATGRATRAPWLLRGHVHGFPEL